MGSVLVVYGTKSGSTAEIAEGIGKALTEAGAKVEVVPVGKKPDPTKYDAVVVGSGTRAGHWYGAVSRWVVAHGKELSAKPTALFTVCLTAAAGPEKAAEVRAYTDPLLAQTGLKPVDVGLFAGWHLPERLGFLPRLLLKAMKSPRGDFRDMEAVAAWSKAVAPKLGVG